MPTATCEYCGQAVLVPDDETEGWEVCSCTVGAVAVNLSDGSKAAMRINGDGELEISRSKRRKISNTTKSR